MHRSIIISSILLFCVPIATLSADCGDQTTQSGMNQCAYGEYQKSNKELNEVYRAYRSRLDANQKQQLKDVQLVWVKYRDLTCDFESSGVKGGSVYPFIRQSCLTKMTRARLQEIKFLAHCEEGDLSCPASKN